MYYNNSDGAYLGLLLIPVALWVLYEVLVRNPRIAAKEKANKLLEEEMKQQQNRNRERSETVPKRRGSQRVYLPTSPAMNPVYINPDVVPVVNIKNWFIDDWVSGMKISPAEQLIINELSKYPIVWHREVSWKGFISPKGSYYRYDFYIPGMNLCIEYDGQQYHDSEQSKIDDSIKTEFCIKNGIQLIRLNRKHYYKMEQKIKELLGR